MRILVADDEPNARYGMVKALKKEGREILEAANGQEALQILREQSPDLVFLDLNMPELGGLEVLSALQKTPGAHACEIVVVTASDTLDQAVECIRRGASDFLAKPFDVDHLRAIASRSQRHVELRREANVLKLKLSQNRGWGSLLGASPAMKALFEQIGRAAKSDLPVLLRGESGTGKELVARELHARSDRSQGPFIAINAAAMPDHLVESELFGHVKGAFTGAERSRDGAFLQAHGGTLFLDEIGDMPFGIQTRLLRVLQEKVVQPVGADRPIPIDVRWISATHQNLEQGIEDKLFRQDLYYRLRGIELYLPPLRHRPEDILLLCDEYAEHRSFSHEAIAALLQYNWPGNVRELKQRIQSAMVMTDAEVLQPMHLGLATAPRSDTTSLFETYLDYPLTEGKQRVTEDFERFAIERALRLEDGNVTGAAKRLGIHRQSLQQKMKQLGL